MTESREEILKKLKEGLCTQHYAHVPRSSMLQLLDLKEHDVNNIKKFHLVWDSALPQRSTDTDVEVYPYKKTLQTYYNLVKNNQSKRSNTHNFKGGVHPVLGKDCVYEQIDNTTSTTGFAHATHGRIHRAFPIDIDNNPVQIALHKLLNEILTSPELEHIGLETIADAGDNNSNKKDCNQVSFWENMQTAFRVTKGKTKHGEPGPEGVHQDICHLTVIILMQRKNVTNNSGGNRIWSLEQKCGKPTKKDITSSNKILKQVIMREQFEALFVLDRKAKHEALPIEVDDDDNLGVAIRDVLTFEVRRRGTFPVTT